MATPQLAAPGDLENGNPAAEARRDTVADPEEKLGEYQGLVRYISTYREGKAVSVLEEDEDEKPQKKRFWQRKSGTAGAGFETPDEWLETDLKRGLSSHDVEVRRRKTGWNELVTEKQNPILQFLGYFNGPILWGELNALS